jgi:hypothetical protein
MAQAHRFSGTQIAQQTYARVSLFATMGLAHEFPSGVHTWRRSRMGAECNFSRMRLLWRPSSLIESRREKTGQERDRYCKSGSVDEPVRAAPLRGQAQRSGCTIARMPLDALSRRRKRPHPSSRLAGCWRSGRDDEARAFALRLVAAEKKDPSTLLARLPAPITTIS